MKKLILLLIICWVFAACDNSTIFIDETPAVDMSTQIFEDERTDSLIVNNNEVKRAAINIAHQINIDVRASRTGEPFKITRINDKDGKAAIYVVNFYDDKGFVLISATKAHQPILAFNNTGNFELSSQNLSLSNWVNKSVNIISSDTICQENVNKAKNLWKPYEANQKIPQSRDSFESRSIIGVSEKEMQKLDSIMISYVINWSNKGYYPIKRLCNFVDFDPEDDQNQYKTLVEPHIYPAYIYDYQNLTYYVEYSETFLNGTNGLSDITWSQSWDFNQSFPILENGCHAYAGCTTIAAGQIMRHYQHPSKYDWSSMPLDKGSKITSDFLYELASGANPDYSITGTGISLKNMANQMRRFGYSVKYDTYSESKIDNMSIIHTSYQYQDSINATHHTIVVSGSKTFSEYRYSQWWTFLSRYNFAPFETTKIYESNSGIIRHVNWGWGGKNNGWYSDIERAVPDGAEHKGNKYIIYDIKPNR